ncbi:hypothetical protein F2P79_015713 [Pimephales promelas]|nr:hypothetical protein F2P79_015713 [Pimephales promelas]
MPPSLKAFAFCRREREAAENERKKCIAPISPAAGFLWASQDPVFNAVRTQGESAKEDIFFQLETVIGHVGI